MAEKKKPQRRTRKRPADQEESPQAQAPETEAPQAHATEAEAPRAEAPETEAPQGDATEAEAPRAEAPEPEAPQAEAAQVEAPHAEAVQADAPEEAPRAEAAGTTEAPQTEAPSPRTEAAGEQPLAAEQPSAEPAMADGGAEPAAGQAPAEAQASTDTQTSEGGEEKGAQETAEPAPRAKPAVPGAHLEVDIVPEGVDPLARSQEAEEYEDRYAIEEQEPAAPGLEEQEEEREETLTQPIASATIDLAAGARYRATGKRKTAIARVTLRPGSGTYLINGRTLEEHFPRSTLQRNIRQPLETVGYQERMDVVARLHGGGISAQAGALRHGVSRALLEADPNLRGELKRRGFLTRDSRAKERKKAGLKKARKRPQFSKR